MTAVGAAPAAAPHGIKTNADVWDAWPVDRRRFGEATTTARRAADDALGRSEVGRDWSRRVDEAVHGLDRVDPSRLDGWMQAHAESPVPELYEARLVAAWESRAEQNAPSRGRDQADDGAHDRADDRVDDVVDAELSARHDDVSAEDSPTPPQHSAATAALPAERVPPPPCLTSLDAVEDDFDIDHDAAGGLDQDVDQDFETFTDEYEDVDSWC